MNPRVLGFDQIDRSLLPLVGGKGAHLGELARIEGIRVPPGFCVTTEAYRAVIGAVPGMEERLTRLARLRAEEQDLIQAQSAEIRDAIESFPLPEELAAEIRLHLTRLGERSPCAVRSSATAEDLPTASFAGQQDTYLNVVGADSILHHVRRCWASLFTDRAVIYRLRNGFDHRAVRMGVVVQQMIFPDAAGILFTADPITGNRRISSIEACFGLGEALVAGRVSPDVYRVRDGEIVERTIGEKRLALAAAPEGGTREEVIDSRRRAEPVLSPEQTVRLASLGRRIEARFGRPQDIEWCLAGGEFYIVQARPITTLFPIPAREDQEKRVYLSVGHQQMMTDAMKPLGISFWQHSAGRPMFEAGARLFVDVTGELASTSRRQWLVQGMTKSDPLTGDALRTLLERGDFVPPPAPEDPAPSPAAPPPSPPPALEADAGIVAGLIARTRDSIDTLKREIATRSGSQLIEFILEDLQELKRLLHDPESLRVIMSGMEATWWLNARLEEWLGEKNAADTIAQSVPNNVTSEMGLALLDVADVVRGHPEVVSFLQQVDEDVFLEELLAIPGGGEARAALQAWLDEYGMRAVGEIDITRPRWSERPAMLVPLLLGNVRNFAPGEGQRRFEQGRQEAARKEREVLAALREMPDGASRAEEARRMIARVRAFSGYREYPKYGMISRYFVYKQALLEEAARLVSAGVLGEPEDIFHLTLPELLQTTRTRTADPELIRRRREEFREYQPLAAPRVLTSEGEMLSGAYRRDALPPGALAGLAVSTGTAEGRARVLHEITDAELEAGDILVTRYTDPSWTPAFVAIAALVTEVGGQMTHGAVIAREYGLPAVVGVVEATRRIRDGQRIRVDGTLGYVEVLD